MADPGGATGGHGPPPQTVGKKFFLHYLKKLFKKFSFTLLFKLLKLPPSNSNPRNLIDYPPPLKIVPENSLNHPPRIHGTSSTNPPSKSGRKTLSTTPPLEFTEPHRLPPSKSGRKTPSTTPPRIHGRNGNSPPPPNSIPRSATAPPSLTPLTTPAFKTTSTSFIHGHLHGSFQSPTQNATYSKLANASNRSTITRSIYHKFHSLHSNPYLTSALPSIIPYLSIIISKALSSVPTNALISYTDVSSPKIQPHFSVHTKFMSALYSNTLPLHGLPTRLA